MNTLGVFISLLPFALVYSVIGGYLNSKLQNRYSGTVALTATVLVFVLFVGATIAISGDGDSTQRELSTCHAAADALCAQKNTVELEELPKHCEKLNEEKFIPKESHIKNQTIMCGN